MMRSPSDEEILLELAKPQLALPKHLDRERRERRASLERIRNVRADWDKQTGDALAPGLHGASRGVSQIMADVAHFLSPSGDVLYAEERMMPPFPRTLALRTLSASRHR